MIPSIARIRLAARLLLLPAVAALPLAGCTQAQIDAGASPSYLIVTQLTAASGATPNDFGGILQSDVLTLVRATIDGEEVRVPTIFEDFAEVEFDLGLKDPGTPSSPTRPTSANFITINRYRVEFFRADGRSTPGLDVPYGFDGAVTLTVAGPGSGTSFALVRNQAKSEAPLQALANGGGAVAISAIAKITFYGRDQAGRDVSATAQISVHFADWGDPE
jgi:hypothetical protein